MVRFKYCGVAVTCSTFFASNPKVVPEMIEYSDVWTFELKSGVNTLYLDTPYLAYQGSIVMWISNSSDAQLYLNQNWGIDDYIMTGNTVSKLTDDASGLQISLQVLATVYIRTQLLFETLVFPYPDTYDVFWTMSSPLKTVNCSIVVTDGI